MDPNIGGGRGGVGGTFFNPKESPNSSNSQKDSGWDVKERAALYTKKLNYVTEIRKARK